MFQFDLKSGMGYTEPIRDLGQKTKQEDKYAKSASSGDLYVGI